MTPLGHALQYAGRGWPVFPCQWRRGSRRKNPLIEHSFKQATVDAAAIATWWRKWPHALIGVPTGMRSGIVVLDIDVKHPPVNGFDTLDELGFAILPDTPMVHTASGGLHLYFTPPSHPIRNTQSTRGARGIGPGLDWRGDGGYVILPAAKSGYRWDPVWNLDTAAPAPVPAALLPREPEPRCIAAQPIEPTDGLSPYADAALDRACRAIIAAPCGEQETDAPQRGLLDWHTGCCRRRPDRDRPPRAAPCGGAAQRL
jgi:putative DNA primase/helicase